MEENEDYINNTNLFFDNGVQKISLDGMYSFQKEDLLRCLNRNAGISWATGLGKSIFILFR